ncbi:MAG: Mrp/NBP35 family ATP-binding protein [Proteobacteria bacterium]|nr:Mrp/NBP35 family ATP-binding protein [Pseudomonadota bacterium]
MDSLEQKIRDAFQQIPFGENGGSILDNNVVYSMEIDKDTAQVVLVIPEEYQSIKEETARKVEEGLKLIEGINEVRIQIVASAQETEASSAANPAPPEQANYLQEYKNVILVASGKGGVGKSTVAINLALALKVIGKTVSIMDADVYGPSIPIMFGRRNEPLKIEGNQIKPLNQFGIDFMSVGNMVDEEQALIWRGPMTHQVIQQILRDSAWPGGDYMIVDLPPGTGDVQLSLAQLTEATGAVVVCTPQDVALLDARKAIAMFEKVNIPILGMIENMSAFICPKCGAETPIFAKGGTEKESEAQQVAFIGRIPIEMDIRLGSDSGDPVVHAMPNSNSAKVFKEMAEKLDTIMAETD